MKKSNILKKVQNIQLEILVELDKICKTYNINYFIFYGTLIGAVRHKGFIPWDDDIDIVLLRNDYEKLIKILNKELPQNMYLHTKYNDKKNYSNIAKIRMKNTYMYEKQNKRKHHSGIFIDLLPLDYVSENEMVRKKHFKKVNIYHRLKSSHLKVELSLKYPIKSILRILKKAFKVIPLRVYVNKIDKLSQKHNKVPTRKVACFAWGENKITHNKSDFDDITFLEFEGVNVMAPKNFDKLLKETYGDYMKLPPIEERVPSHVTKISFDGNKFYEGYNYIDK